MRFMIGAALVAAGFSQAAAQGIDNAAMGSSVAAAQQELTTWFELLRGGNARAAWERAHARLHQIYSVETWQQGWSGVIGTVQPIVGRKITAVRYVPADSARNPETVVFDTRVEFQGGTVGGETVAVALEGGAWRVWDYAISPSGQYLARYTPFYHRRWVPVPQGAQPAAPDTRITNRVNPRPKVPRLR